MQSFPFINSIYRLEHNSSGNGKKKKTRVDLPSPPSMVPSPLHVNTDRTEFSDDRFISAVDVINPVYGRFAPGAKPSEDKGSGSPQIGCDHSCTSKFGRAFYDGLIAGDRDVRAHSDQFRSVHEPVL